MPPTMLAIQMPAIAPACGCVCYRAGSWVWSCSKPCAVFSATPCVLFLKMQLWWGHITYCTPATS
eukprot:793737-Pelagomonas_calceolata.AAC.8